MNARATRRPGSRGRKSSGRSMRGGPPSSGGGWLAKLGCPLSLVLLLAFTIAAGYVAGTVVLTAVTS